MDISVTGQGMEMDTLRRLRGNTSKSNLMEISSIAQDDSEEGVRLAAREFTGMFMGQMLKAMRSTVEVSDFMSGGEAEKTFQGMVDDEWARNMAYNGDIDDSNNIVSVVYDSLKRKSTANAYAEFLKNQAAG